MKAKILGMRVDPTSYDAALQQILEWAKAVDSRRVCLANVHMVMEAWDSPIFQAVVNQADIVAPDGMPLVWILRFKGQHEQSRVYGPDLTLCLLEAAARLGVPVGFYGGRPEVLSALVNRMEARYPGLKIPYSFSPPYHRMTDSETSEITRDIRESGARILLVGLGCPKQELWMAEHMGQIPAVMVGVGAAFDFHAGVKRQAPFWMQSVGMEWLFRLIQEPRRLGRRYLYHNTRFVVLAFAELLGVLRIGDRSGRRSGC